MACNKLYIQKKLYELLFIIFTLLFYLSKTVPRIELVQGPRREHVQVPSIEISNVDGYLIIDLSDFSWLFCSSLVKERPSNSSTDCIKIKSIVFHEKVAREFGNAC